MARTHIAVALGFFVLIGPALSTIAARAQEPGDADVSAEEARQRQVMERFLALLEKNPRRGTALDRVYGYHVERGSLDAFVKSYEQRVAKDPGDGAAWLLLGLLEAQRGRDAAAVTALKKAEAARPKDPMASYYLGEALVLVGQPEEAVAAFERAIDRKPSRTDLLTVFQALGRVHQRAYHTAEALAVWNRLETLFPDDLRVQEQIAATLAEESEPARALPRYEALVQKTTDPYRKVQFRIEAAELKVRLNRTKEALRDFEALLGRLNPDSWLYRDVRHRIEEVYLRNDDQAGLAAYYEGWLKQSPEDVEAMARLGRTLAGLGRTKDAEEWLHKAVKLAPSRKELRLALVEQLVRQKRFPDAASQYEAMAKADPNNPDLIRDWGRLLLRDTDRPEAERKQAAAAVWRKLVEARPKDAATAVVVADLLRQAEMPDEAVALYRMAITLAPDSPQYHEYLGEFFHKERRPDEARAAWARMAEGKNHNAKNLGRLAEVLARFGYLKEALEPSAEACRLAPDDFDIQFKRAGWLMQLKQYDQALAQLDHAAKAADGPEQNDAVLMSQIRAYEASGQLPGQIAALRAELDAGKDATAERWRRLARYNEAAQNLGDALNAIGNAVALDDRSVACWVVQARILEEVGDFGGAVLANRKLAALDRKSRSDYLTAIAKLEVRLGRTKEALAAGREVLAAAPSNPDVYQFYANLCMQLGDVDEALNALRRAVRVNPNDKKALTMLGETLAREFRTAEAIEVYWRAFERTPELDSRLAIIARLTDLHLLRNQFDRLIARLELAQRDAKQPRELVLCLAQAYQSSGDVGAARSALEGLLATTPRDTLLLRQLVNLAEGDDDLTTAAKYQAQLNEIAPSDDGAAHLAQLYYRTGQATEAEVVWSRLANGQQPPYRILQSIDSLLSSRKAQTALEIIERFLREHPDSWEGLYRRGVALRQLEKYDEAERAFQTLVGLQVDESAESEAAKKARTSTPGRVGRASLQPSQATVSQGPRVATNMQSLFVVRNLIRGEQIQDRYFNPYSTFSWSPADFGQARTAALSWLVDLAQKQNALDARIREWRAAGENAQQDPRALWDWYYVSAFRAQNRETFDAALALSRRNPDDAGALWALFHALPTRATAAREPAADEMEGEDDEPNEAPVPPLAAADLDHVLSCYKRVRQRKLDWLNVRIASAVGTELRRAHRNDEATHIYKDVVAERSDLDQSSLEMLLADENTDVDAALASVDRFVARPAAQTGRPRMDALADALIQLMARSARAHAHADVFKIVDHYFDWYVRPDVTTARQTAYLATRTRPADRVFLMLPAGKGSEFLQITYPPVNIYFNEQAIQMLRAAFELSKRAGALEPFLAHVRERAANARPGSVVVSLLALSDVQWWNDQKDESVRTLTHAVSLGGGNPDLRMTLATILAQRGANEDALAVLEKVDAYDQQILQRRELMALRLAALSGNVARARVAAERLFNLRLDTNLQVQLAGQMHQLGMHDLAEAVLARARRKAGNNTDTLVALMEQYQQQNDTETAVQIARQILRRAPAPANSRRGFGQDAARVQAVQVLARSGKLPELIERVEAQLKTSPNSVELLQALADYYRAAKEPKKARAALDRIATLRSGDAQIRFKMGMELHQAGDHAGAVEHFKAALGRDPSPLALSYWQIQRSFEKAGKLDELLKLIDASDLRKLGGYQPVAHLVDAQLRRGGSNEVASRLFRKAWNAYPDNRLEIIASLNNDALGRLPDVYGYIRDAVIPAVGQRTVRRWAGLEGADPYAFRREPLLNRLLLAAEQAGKLDALDREIAQSLERFPHWSAGRVLATLVKVREGKLDEAKTGLEALLANESKKAPMPAEARIVVAKAIEDRKPLEPVAIRLYEEALKQEPNSDTFDYNEHPVHRLAVLYHKAGRSAEARDLVVAHARRMAARAESDESFVPFDRVDVAKDIGGELLRLGFPADAVSIYSSVLSNPDALREAASEDFGGFSMRELRNGLTQALAGLNEKTLPPSLRALLKPGQNVKGQAIDLIFLVNPRELDRAKLTSFGAEIIRKASREPKLAAEMESSLKELATKAPRDFSVLTAQALAAASGKDPRAFETAVERLLDQAGKEPLGALAADTRPTAEQRTDAARRLGLWLIARECWSRMPLQATGDRLAEIALEGALRQSDSVLPLALLREWGQGAHERGHASQAQRLWTRMLDLALPDAPAPVKPGSGKSAVVGITLERFLLASQVAELAAKKKMFDLSLQAARRSLQGGPPIVPIPIDENAGGPPTAPPPRLPGLPGETSNPVIAVEERLTALNSEWRLGKADPAAVYQALCDVVLPPGRPAEMFLYPRPLAESGLEPRSVAGHLVKWAVLAGRVDDLKARIKARRNAKAAGLEADVLTGLLALAAHDHVLVTAMLDALNARLKKDELATSAELTCLVGVPALDNAKTLLSAVALLTRAASRLPDSPARGKLHKALARAEFRLGNAEEGRKHLRDHQASLLRNVRERDDLKQYNALMRKQHLQEVAMEFARAGQWADTLDTLGQLADAPRFDREDRVTDNVLTLLGRGLARLPVEERFERLRTWTMPAANRQSIRLLTSTAPREAPPSAFGDGSIGMFDDGVVSTAGLLIDAAVALNKRDELVRALEALAGKKVENAETLLILARGDGGAAVTALKARLDALEKERQQPEEKRQGMAWSDVLLGRVALRDRTLGKDQGLEIPRRLIERSTAPWDGTSIALLRHDLAREQAARAGASDRVLGPEPGLAFWHNAGVSSADGYGQGFSRAWWVESERHIKHLGGPGEEALLLDIPLTGMFEFSVDAWTGDRAGGLASYGGLIFDASPSDAFSAVYPFGRAERLDLGSQFVASEQFNRITVQVQPGSVRCLVNGHLFYRDDDPSPTAPWLALDCWSDVQSTFRNVTITGAPTIPPQVALSHADRLEGWVSRFYDQSQPPRRTLRKDDPQREVIASDRVLQEYDWVARDGEIQCRKIDSSGSAVAMESRLYYIRPLREGDQLSYEFFYEPNDVMVYPSIDRIAFLMTADGVKLHWMTAGPEHEWTGIPADNAIADRGLRTGPNSVPLKRSAWNTARVAIDHGAVVLAVNEVEVARRPLEPNNGRQFGLFHFRDRTAARVRNVVLRGNWPKSLPADLLTREPAAKPNPADALARHELVGEEMLCESAADVLKTARAMPDEKRYAYLREWVLPGEGKPDFRMAVTYTPTDAAPPVAAAALDPPDNTAETRRHTGGAIDAPALELVSVARRLGKLDELAAVVANNQSDDEQAECERVALRALIHLAQERDDLVGDELRRLTALVRARPNDDGAAWSRVPEQIVSWASLGRPALQEPSVQLLRAQLEHWMKLVIKNQAVGRRQIWGLQMTHTMWRSDFLATSPERRAQRDVSVRLPLWSRVEHATAWSRASGCPSPRWWVRDGVLHHGQGHREDFMYLNIPLRGDFEVSCETRNVGSGQMHLLFGALMTATRVDGKATTITHFGLSPRERTFDPPLDKGNKWYPVRLVVKDNRYTVFVQERQVYEDFLSKEPDPWLAIHQQAAGFGSLRGLRITGNPTVPTSLSLSSGGDLTGWLADYYGETTDGETPSWTRKGDEIVGANFGSDDPPPMAEWGGVDMDKVSRTARLGSKQESLLQYHRPLLEDGTLEYEFFYAPGKTMAYPTIDRLALMIDPGGVKIHWLTDGKYDRTMLAPDNLTDEPAARRGPSSLSLKPNAWNRATVALRGSTIRLTVNGGLVYERSLEPTNNRMFGFFHYADETEARVRNVVYRGEWPKTLPAEVFGPGLRQ